MIHYRHSLKTTKYLKSGQSVSKWIFELRTNESTAELLGSEMYESWYMLVDWTARVLLSSLLHMTLTTRYSVFLSTGQFWTQCLNKLQFIPRLLSEIRHRWPLIRQTYLEHPLVWARSPHPQNSKRFSVTRPGWNVGLPSLLWHSPQLWQQICQLFEPAALYPFTDWSPELLSTDKTVASFENFQGSHRKSNPVPPILWRSASTNCHRSLPKEHWCTNLPTIGQAGIQLQMHVFSHVTQSRIENIFRRFEVHCLKMRAVRSSNKSVSIWRWTRGHIPQHSYFTFTHTTARTSNVARNPGTCTVGKLLIKFTK